jgi:hypothetical protein
MRDLKPSKPNVFKGKPLAKEKHHFNNKQNDNIPTRKVCTRPSVESAFVFPSKAGEDGAIPPDERGGVMLGVL